MKLSFFVLSLVALTVIFTGCKDNKTITNDIIEEEKNNTLETFENTYEMPKPFGEKSGGDENNAFYSPCVWLFDGIPAELTDLVDYSDFECWRVKYNIFAKAPSSLKEYVNMYSFIVEFDIPNKDVLSALSVFLQTDDQSIAISEEEMNIILSKDESVIAERFASPYSIVIGEHIYSPQWVYENSIAAYKDAGITPKMIEEKLPLYREIKFTEQACEAFENKLGTYLGKTVRLMLDKKELYIGKYTLDWLTSHTIPDYEAAKISIDDLTKLLSKMSGFEGTSEYEWIKSCYDRMLEDINASST